MTDAELQEIEARANAATVGPWAWEPRGVWTMHEDGMGGPVLDVPGPKDQASGTVGYVGDDYPRGINNPSESMEFIAHARTDVPALVTALRDAQWTIRVNADMTDQLQAHVGELGEQLAHRDRTIQQLREIIHNGVAR